MSEPSVVRLTPGTGIVARRAAELLFTSGGSPDLVRTFLDAPLGGAIDDVTSFAEEQSFEIDDFVVIDWSEHVDGIRIAVFGEIEVSSDHRSLPRLSAAGAGTWVERSMRRVDDTVTIGVAGDEANAATDLRDGAVQAGGFQLVCSPAGQRLDPVAAPPTPEPTVAAEPHEEDAVEAPAPQSSVGESATPYAAEPVPVPVPEPVSEPSDPALALADSMLTPSTESPQYAAAPTDPTIVPDSQMRDEISSLVDEHRAAPADSATQSDLPDLSSIGLPTSTTWRLAFADGSVEPVDETLLFGRKPTLRDDDTPETTRLVTLDCQQVSGRHLEVRATGREIHLTDLGSSNGSFVVTTGDGQLVRLEPHTPHRAEVGTLVQIGTKRFRIEETTGSPQ